jgi:L-asparaginase/Glu-tRNA(Gln) amidotransferase subunit D
MHPTWRNLAVLLAALFTGTACVDSAPAALPPVAIPATGGAIAGMQPSPGSTAYKPGAILPATESLDTVRSRNDGPLGRADFKGPRFQVSPTALRPAPGGGFDIAIPKGSNLHRVLIIAAYGHAARTLSPQMARILLMIVPTRTPDTAALQLLFREA